MEVEAWEWWDWRGGFLMCSECCAKREWHTRETESSASVLICVVLIQADAMIVNKLLYKTMNYNDVDVRIFVVCSLSQLCSRIMSNQPQFISRDDKINLHLYSSAMIQRVVRCNLKSCRPCTWSQWFSSNRIIRRRFLVENGYKYSG